MENKKHKIKVQTTPTASIDLSKYCHFSQEHDYMEVVLWGNGEGMKILISTKSPSGDYKDVDMDLTWGQYRALKKLIKSINNYENNK